MKRILLGIYIVLLSTGFGKVWAANYLLSWSSVDSSGGVKEIRWDGSTSYTTAFNNSVATWNARQKVKIAPDIFTTIEDLTIRDVSVPSATWIGRVTQKTGADLMELNTSYMSTYTNNQRQEAITHEFGHTLGLAHSFGSNVMKSSQTSSVITALGTQDIADYVFLYGN